MATAKHRDRPDTTACRLTTETQEIVRDDAVAPENSGDPYVDAMDDHIGDDLLRRPDLHLLQSGAVVSEARRRP